MFSPPSRPSSRNPWLKRWLLLAAWPWLSACQPDVQTVTPGVRYENPLHHYAFTLTDEGGQVRLTVDNLGDQPLPWSAIGIYRQSMTGVVAVQDFAGASQDPIAQKGQATLLLDKVAGQEGFILMRTQGSNVSGRLFEYRW